MAREPSTAYCGTASSHSYINSARGFAGPPFRPHVQAGNAKYSFSTNLSQSSDRRVAANSELPDVSGAKRPSQTKRRTIMNYTTTSTPFVKGLATLGVLLAAGTVTGFAATAINASKSFDDL